MDSVSPHSTGLTGLAEDEEAGGVWGARDGPDTRRSCAEVESKIISGTARAMGWGVPEVDPCIWRRTFAKGEDEGRGYRDVRVLEVRRWSDLTL
jgi:hypothetical protein